MVNEFKLDNALTEHLHFSCELSQMTEMELFCLLDMIERLEEDFRRIPLRKSESLEAVTAAQNLLRIWSREVDQSLLDKLTTELHGQLHNWDNEGGRVAPTPSRRVIVRIEDGKRHLVWADTE